MNSFCNPAEPPLDSLAFSYAFQPIVDVSARRVVSHEALIRSPSNEPAFTVLESVPPALKYRFDQHSRETAVALAMRLGLDCDINLNVLPQGLLELDSALDDLLDVAGRHGLAVDRIILEVTEGEVIADHGVFASRLNTYRARGLRIAIDDFGAGYSGLNLLADFQPDQVKIDMGLVRGIERHGPRQAIVRAVALACGDLGIDVVVEGVETEAEYAWLVDNGLHMFQGYFFAKPLFQAFPQVRFP